MTTLYANLLLFFAISSIYTASLVQHPLHVSTTEVNFNVAEKSLEISCRIYTDDFESILAKSFNTKIDLFQTSRALEMNGLVKKYLQTHLVFRVNGKPTTAKYIGFEQDNEVTNVYLEIAAIPTLQTLSSSNSILYDLFDDQMNILHVERGNGNRRSARANYPNTTMAISFE